MCDHRDIAEFDREKLLEALRNWACAPGVVEEFSFKLTEEALEAAFKIILPHLDGFLLVALRAAAEVSSVFKLGDEFNYVEENPFQSASSVKFMISYDDIICALRRKFSSLESLKSKKSKKELAKLITKLYVALRRVLNVFRICDNEVREFFTHPVGASKYEILNRSARFEYFTTRTADTPAFGEEEGEPAGRLSWEQEAWQLSALLVGYVKKLGFVPVFNHLTGEGRLYLADTIAVLERSFSYDEDSRSFQQVQPERSFSFESVYSLEEEFDDVSPLQST
jgi:hypothetical protein